MKDVLKQINNTKIDISLSIPQATELVKILEKNQIETGQVTENGCVCPRCKEPLIKHRFFCPRCGQRAMYIESDIVPL